MSLARAKRRLCGTMQVHERLLEMHPSFRANEHRIEQFTERSIASGEACAWPVSS